MNTQALRLAFAGTPEFAAKILGGLLAAGRYRIRVVCTQPDRPAGRGRRLSRSPVARLAEQAGVPVRQPATPAEIEAAVPFDEIDALIVAAYGMLLPDTVLNRPRFGCLNVHPSLLPRWRGAAPIQRAIQAGDEETGVSIMQMDAGLDTGDVLLQRHCRIGADETAGSLGERLADIGVECMTETLGALAAGCAARIPQDPARATYARKIRKEESRIDWNRPAVEIERCIRAFNPEPLARTTLDGIDLLVWAAAAHPAHGKEAPGRIVAADADGIVVATGDGALRITRLQAPGKRPVSAADFLNGHPHWRRGPPISRADAG